MIRSLIIAAALLIPCAASAQNVAYWVEFAPGVGVGVVITADGKIVTFNSLTMLKSSPQPPADSNPYPAPPTNFRLAAVEPLRKFSLSPQDGKAIAQVFAQAANKMSSGQIKTTSELRQSIIDQGQPLNLRGKYGGLSDAVDESLELLLGKPDPPRDVTPTDGAAILDMAWALWRAG